MIKKCLTEVELARRSARLIKQRLGFVSDGRQIDFLRQNRALTGQPGDSASHFCGKILVQEDQS
jgi:hypothetical protein